MSTSGTGEGGGALPTPTSGGAVVAPPQPVAGTGPASENPPAKKGGGFLKFLGKIRDKFFKTYLFCALAWYLFWNLPGFLNIVSALRLKKTGKCTIRGYTKAVYFYPIIPVTVLCTLLQLLGVPSFPLAVTWVLVIFIGMLVSAEDVKGASALGAMGIVVAIAAIYAGLWIAGYDVNGWVSNFFHAFTPQFEPGTALLLAAFLAISMFVLKIRVMVKSSIFVDQNQYEVKEIHRTTPYPALEWRLRGVVGDWAEWIWMGATNLVIMSNYGGGRGRIQQSGGVEVRDDEREAASLMNVPGGTIVDRLIWQAMAAFNVESAKSET